MESGLFIFGSVINVASGILFLLMGLLVSEHLDSFFQLFTHREIPDYVKEKPGVQVVLNYLKGVGILFLILGVGLMVYGVLKIGMEIFMP